MQTSPRPSSLARSLLMVSVLFTAMSALLTPAGCRTEQVVEPDVGTLLKGAAPGAFLTGAPAGLGTPTIVNRRDFIYAVGFSRTHNQLAFAHHVSKSMELTSTLIEPLKPLFQQPINTSEFDVEDLVIVDDRAAPFIVVPSRQGVGRAFDAKTGAVLREATFGEPLLRVALSPDGKTVAFGSAEGRVLLLDAATFATRGSAKLHAGEVRGLVFVDDTHIASAGVDAVLVHSALEPPTETTVRIPTTALKSGERVFLAHLDGSRAIATVRDDRQPTTVISRAAVKRLALATASPAVELPVLPASGPATGAGIALPAVHLRQLNLGVITAAVCDACVPLGAELVLGKDLLARAAVTESVATDELLVGPSDTVDHATLTPLAVALNDVGHVALPGPATDLDKAQTGALLVAFSTTKAERSFDLYESEKKGNYPEPAPTSGAAFVDLATHTLGTRFIGHRGFTVTAALSPDGRTVVTGGWDKRVLMFDAQTGAIVTERQLAWLLRRVRFSPDGHLLAAAAWTPVNALNEGTSDPALLLYPVALDEARLTQGTNTPPTAGPG